MQVLRRRLIFRRAGSNITRHDSSFQGHKRHPNSGFDSDRLVICQQLKKAKHNDLIIKAQVKGPALSTSVPFSSPRVSVEPTFLGTTGMIYLTTEASLRWWWLPRV